jgi:hypothetical protein
MALSDLQALLDSYPERWLAAAIAGVELRLNDADAIETSNAQQREKAERREAAAKKAWANRSCAASHRV